MDFDEPALVKEVLRLKLAQEREMEAVAQFIALYKSSDPGQYELVFTYWDQADPLFDEFKATLRVHTMLQFEEHILKEAFAKITHR
eukprot:COSAG03_NODE_1952_length_3307_cov_11.590399_4_plen_85_part_01